MKCAFCESYNVMGEADTDGANIVHCRDCGVEYEIKQKYTIRRYGNKTIDKINGASIKEVTK